MPRPRKWRRLRYEPQPAIFKPVGLPLEALERIILLHEELEALRLADLEGQHQAAAAAQMSVSRSTFQRLVTEARRKVALALVNGAALQIEGGTFRVVATRWHCATCGHDWDIVHGSGQGQSESCPACGSSEVWEWNNQKGRHSA
ncbi:MAG: DUF134 domain-containing protein [Chloroflexi bacterium]|nr:DUF134 domain-containing protein [Chloroflexota bacterium]